MTTAQRTLDSADAAAAGPFQRRAYELRRWSVAALVVLLWCAAGLVGWRRLAGALHKPLHPAVLLPLGLSLAAVAAGARLLWRRSWPESEPSRLGRMVLPLLLTAAVLCFAAAVSLPGTGAGPLTAFWTLLAVEELWAWRPAVWRGNVRGPSRRRPRPQPPPESPPAVPDDDVLQQLTRSRAADGSQQLSGWLRTRFATGQRTASEHVAFCPPFARTPQLTVRQLDGPAARIKTAQLLPHGVRLDLKLAALAENPQTVLLELVARSERET